ncbi:hypothetical protein GZH47_32955 (plasmid) [Paenibacillus rhizovicinus]|uniref:Uncharacterized protein n=1 Tax=Paenibacillus rhizovicinus TaxID=2704463 RepID=A0A6C0PAV0_9BACL|nr:hypothetical protein [Paenibacillus rhizovicinus]QHW35704.1 hypothetical protein GZH47_32955 [Paenibacillus rhizovicinus]
MGAKPLRRCSFTKDSVKHYARLQRTGDRFPQPARIVVDKEYFEHVGGVYGMETVAIYDKIYEDWAYAHAVYDEILRRADPNSLKELK